MRLTAFLIQVADRPKLAAALRAQDTDLHRHLFELEHHGKKLADKVEIPKAKKPRGKLSEEDRLPLVEAMACRALDTCLRGAVGLARLQDGRAFGTLLQLSREQDTSVRVETCKALRELGDLRGIQRLKMMLRDPESQVRDAAFTGLTRLEPPLVAAEAGLAAPFEDVRQRALSLVVRQVKQSKAKTPPKGSGALLEKALNDSSQSVRGEAFKAVLNLQFDGGDAATLRFARRSRHPDVRQDVLVEIMGQIEKPWARPQLLELFEDPDPKLRQEAFEFGLKRQKGRDTEALAKALAGRYPDLRKAAAKELTKRKDARARELLVKALDDEERDVRQLAIDALLVAEERGPLIQALASRHSDVRIRAARARAHYGDLKALRPLLTLATAEEPKDGEHTEWLQLVVKAVEGLGELGSPDSRAEVAALLKSEHPSIREAAARALGWCSRPGQIDELKEALKHDDKKVRIEAAFGLAWCGDATGASLVFPPSNPKQAKRTSSRTRHTAKRRASKLPRYGGRQSSASSTPAVSAPFADAPLMAALSLENQGEEALLSFLDSTDVKVRDRALRCLLLRDAGLEDGSLDRLLAALSSAHPRVRMVAAGALKAVSDRARFRNFVLELFNDRGDEKASWAFDWESVGEIGEVLAHGDPQLKARAVRLLRGLDQGGARRVGAAVARVPGTICLRASTAAQQRRQPQPQFPSLLRERARAPGVRCLCRPEPAAGGLPGGANTPDRHFTPHRQSTTEQRMAAFRAGCPAVWVTGW